MVIYAKRAIIYLNITEIRTLEKARFLFHSCKIFNNIFTMFYKYYMNIYLQ